MGWTIALVPRSLLLLLHLALGDTHLFVQLGIMSLQRALDMALRTAAEDGKLEEIQSLLDRRADVNAVAPHYNTPLHFASANGRHQCVELLLDRHANVDAVNGFNYTPLHCASCNGHRQCVELLINRGADKSIKNVREDGRDTSLHLLLI